MKILVLGMLVIVLSVACQLGASYFEFRAGLGGIRVNECRLCTARGEETHAYCFPGGHLCVKFSKEIQPGDHACLHEWDHVESYNADGSLPDVVIMLFRLSPWLFYGGTLLVTLGVWAVAATWITERARGINRT